VRQKGNGKSRGLYLFFCGKGKENRQLEAEFSVHHNIVSAVKTVEFVRDWVSYTECPRRKGQYSGRSYYLSF